MVSKKWHMADGRMDSQPQSNVDITANSQRPDHKHSVDRIYTTTCECASYLMFKQLSALNTSYYHSMTTNQVQ